MHGHRRRHNLQRVVWQQVVGWHCDESVTGDHRLMQDRSGANRAHFIFRTMRWPPHSDELEDDSESQSKPVKYQGLSGKILAAEWASTEVMALAISALNTIILPLA